MKKNYVMLALASMMMAACANNDLVDEGVVKEEVPQAIGFETFAQKATRATENSGEDYGDNDLKNHHGTFKVWASKQLADATYVDVYAAGSPGTVTWTDVWTANPLKYWDKAATNYYFYAAAPSSPSWVYTNATTSDGSTGYLTLADYVLKGTANDNLATGANTDLGTTWKAKTHEGKDLDLMIAAPCPVTSTHYYNVESPEAVNLDFIHILSRLNIAVRSTVTGVKLSALNVVGLRYSGDFNENAAITPGTLATGTSLRWNTDTPADKNTYVLAGKIGNDGLSLTNTAVYTHEYLVMPQTQTNSEATVNKGTAPTTDAYIYIEYTLGGETFKTYYGLAQAFGIAEDASLAFNEGWQNTLTLTISPDAIVFTADAAAWDDNVNYDDTNSTID